MTSLRPLLPLALVLILCDTVYVQGTGNTAADCCLQTSKKRIPPNAVSAYEVQSLEKGCPKAAVVFITKTSHRLCATPGLEWVTKLMKKLDKKGKDPSKKTKGGKKQKKAQKNSKKNPK